MVGEEISCQARMDIHYALYSINTIDVLIYNLNKPASTLMFIYVLHSFN